MRRSAKIFVCALAGAAVAIPVALVLAGGGNAVFGNADRFTTVHTGKQEITSKQWKPIPQIAELSSTDGPQTIVVSAAMVRGRAKVRVFDADVNTVVKPGPVAFSARASNAFSWGVADNCPDSHQLQWKRVGKAKAVAAKVSAQRIVQSSPCI